MATKKQNKNITIILSLGVVITVVIATTLVKSMHEFYSKKMMISQPTVEPMATEQTLVFVNPEEEPFEWAVYRNEEWGIQLEYPDDWRFVVSRLTDVKTGGYQASGDSLVLTIKIALARDTYTFRIKSNDNPEILSVKGDAIPIQPKRNVTIGSYTWRVFDGVNCTKHEFQTQTCEEVETMPFLTYSTDLNGFWYQLTSTNPDDENSEIFQHIIRSVKLFPPRQ